MANVSLYILTFNDPNQLCISINSLEFYPELLSLTTKYVVDNSINNDDIKCNREICETYKINYVGVGRNLGISGGRQYVAHHFHNNTRDGYYFYFEDSKIFCTDPNERCRSGFFRTMKTDIIDTMVGIINKHNLDFLKMHYSEVYGNNHEQWSYDFMVNSGVYTQQQINKYFPNAYGMPKVKVNEINTYNGNPYFTGEVYYDNWPSLFTREGNRKVFINHPHLVDEKTIAAKAYELIYNGELKTGSLLMSMIKYTGRQNSYNPSLRREN